MGVEQSSFKQLKKVGNFYEIIDYIATNYILTMDFKIMNQLSEKEYCDKLVILSSDIIERYFTDMEVVYMEQRIKEGIEVNDMTKDKIVFLNKDQLTGMDIDNDRMKSIKKRRVCIGIAKFYVKIAHIFAAIMTTVNPIPSSGTRNICDNRIRILKSYIKDDLKSNVGGAAFDQPPETQPGLNPTPELKQPTICDLTNLKEEPGITEFMNLYLDKYDYSTGQFTGMTPEMRKKYEHDLKYFYKAFTGNDDMPSNIQQFSDIKLRDYQKLCSKQSEIPISKSDKLYDDYANNLKKMIQRAAAKQTQLLDVINSLFKYIVDPYTKKVKVRVSPDLTEILLQKLVEQTRNIIMDLYINCEKDYVNGIRLYETIVEMRILETTQKQIDELERELKQVLG